MSCENIQIIVVEMSPEMQQDAVERAREAQKNYSAAKDIAKHIKQKFDYKYGPSWHCVVGRHFSSYVSHENYGFIYFYVGPIAILLFKSG